MIVSDNKDLIYNIDTLVILPEEDKDKAEIVDYNFGNVYVFKPSLKEAEELINFIKDNNIKELVLVDYRLEYEKICENLKDKMKIYGIFTKELAALSTEFYSIQHDGAIKLLKEKKIEKLAFYDKNLYELAKNSYKNVCHIYVDVEKEEANGKVKKSGVGLLNEPDDPKHSYFNELSALTITGDGANIASETDDIKRFTKNFELDIKEFEKDVDIIENSDVCLYVNFCNNQNTTFLKAMDRGVPCVLGNTMLLKDYFNLDKALRLKSDDDINEIVEKIKYVRKNKKSILEDYKKFRKDYSKYSKESIEYFLGYDVKNVKEDEKYEKLLTVGIPVYNVEDYLAASIESVVKAVNKENTEIVIVNDGSTDNSEEIIKKYEKKYPDLIRYIKQENHGLGNVRNVIMDNAKGKYIASIDSDDTINTNFFKEAEEYLEKDVDVVLCDWLSIYGEDKKEPTEASDSNFKNFSSYKKLLYSTIMPSNCNKIVKKSIYKSIGLRFVEGHKFEDLGTNPITMIKVKNIKYINKPYYEYNIRQNSIMRSNAGFNMIDVLRILEDRLNKYVDDKEANKDELRAYVYFWRFEEFIINQWYKLEIEERDKMIDYTLENVKDIIDNLYKDNKYVNEMIDRVDEETKKFVKERNKAILSGKIKEFLDKNKDKYKILTPALILYNYDNRPK